MVFLTLQARYTGFRDRPLHERQAKFQQACREGQIELVWTNLRIDFNIKSMYYSNKICQTF